jgi:hypothetical protein
VALTGVVIYLSSYEYLGLWDWPNHLIRHALQCAVPSVSSLQQFYEFRLGVAPNIASDLLHALPLFCDDVLFSQRILMVYYCVGLVLSGLVLHWAVWRRISVWPLVTVLAVFNTNFHYGFENYLISMPISILFVALWIICSTKWSITYALFLSSAAFLLYNFHLFGFGFAIFVAASYELNTAIYRIISQKQTTAAILRLGRVALVAMIPVLHFLYTILIDAPRSIGATNFGELLDRLLVPASLSSPFLLGFMDVPTNDETLLGLALILAIPMVICLLQKGIQLDRPVALVGLAAVGLCLIVPEKTATVSLTHVRFPPLAFVVFVAAIDFRLSVRSQYVAAALISTGLLIRTSDIDVRWAQHSREVSELVATMEGMNPAVRLLWARDGHGQRVIGHVNSYAYAVLKTGMYVPTIYHGANTLEVRPEFADRASEQGFPIDLETLLLEEAARCRGETFMTIPRLMYLKAWREYYTHVLVLHGEDGLGEKLDRFSARRIEGSFFDLYEIAPVEGPSRGCEAPAVAPEPG